MATRKPNETEGAQDGRASASPPPGRSQEGSSFANPNPHSGENGRKTRNRLASANVNQNHLHRQEVQQEEAPMTPDLLYKYLVELFPARSSEIKQILGLLGEPCDPLIPLFVYGGASTGKTSILLEIFRQIKRPFAYTSCRSCHTPRMLFESILNQLLRHTRSSANNYSSAKKCDKLVDFLGFIGDACFSASLAKPVKGHNKSHGGDVDGDIPSQPVVYLIFDNVELLLDWPGGSRLISALLRLSELSSLASLGLVCISSLGLDAFFSGTGMLEPIPVYMRDYTDDDLRQILLKRKPQGELYSAFLSAVLKPFTRVTRRVTELAEALEPLFQKYTEPIRCGVVKPDEQGKRKLFSLIQLHVMSALQQTCSLSVSKGLQSSKGGQQRKGSVDGAALEFQLSLCSKYLLVSAFICSRNPATLDSALFDSGGGCSRKRRRRSSQTSLEKKELDRQEKLLKGPGTFPLERLLAIYCCISADSIDDDAEETDVSEAKNGADISSDVLMQVSTLVNANLLYKGSSDPLEGAPRYRCNATEELVQMVARSINFPLSRYLYRI